MDVFGCEPTDVEYNQPAVIICFGIFGSGVVKNKYIETMQSSDLFVVRAWNPAHCKHTRL